MKKKVLLVIESCNPEMSSVPLVGYNFLRAIEKFSNVHLVTHCRNKEALQRHGMTSNVTYYEQSFWEINYYKLICLFSTFRGQVIWPVRHALQFPIYFFFDRFVHKKFSNAVSLGEYDIVHALTPILPRYPYKILRSCKNGKVTTPFILGPVNGGVPYPESFNNIARKEFSYLNWIRKLGGWLVPGYRHTYLDADIILAGSTYTYHWLKNMFPTSAKKMQLMYENGVSKNFYQDNQCRHREFGQVSLQTIAGSSDKDYQHKIFRLLFIGRLEPYKGCDMLVEAIAGLPETERARLNLSIVGDGSQRILLEERVSRLGLSEIVEFKGWVAHSNIPSELASADIFCFPSIREFGGAVVMEAMASGIPCIVVENGGIGEYVTETCGVKIPPLNRDYVIEKLQENIIKLANDPLLLDGMVAASKVRAAEFSWATKSIELAKIYDEAIQASRNNTSIAVGGI